MAMPAKFSDEDHLETLRRECRVPALIHGLDVPTRLVAIDRADLLFDGSDRCLRVTPRCGR